MTVKFIMSETTMTPIDVYAKFLIWMLKSLKVMNTFLLETLLGAGQCSITLVQAVTSQAEDIKPLEMVAMLFTMQNNGCI